MAADLSGLFIVQRLVAFPNIFPRQPTSGGPEPQLQVSPDNRGAYRGPSSGLVVNTTPPRGAARRRRHGHPHSDCSGWCLRYITCGDLHKGFAHICREVHGTERVLASSSRERSLCPSYGKERAVEFGEWLCGHLLRAVPYRHTVLSRTAVTRNQCHRIEGKIG